AASASSTRLRRRSEPKARGDQEVLFVVPPSGGSGQPPEGGTTNNGSNAVAALRGAVVSEPGASATGATDPSLTLRAPKYPPAQLRECTHGQLATCGRHSPPGTMGAMFTERAFNSGELLLNHAVGPVTGPPLLLLHGVTRCWRDFVTLVPPLAPRWQLHGLDFRGHGRSARAPGKYLVTDYVRDAAA